MKRRLTTNIFSDDPIAKDSKTMPPSGLQGNQREGSRIAGSIQRRLPRVEDLVKNQDRATPEMKKVYHSMTVPSWQLH